MLNREGNKVVLVGPLPKAAAAVLIVLLTAVPSFAIDPTSLQTASGMEGETIELQQKLELKKYDDETEWESETSIEYELSQRFALRLKIPYEFGDEDSLGDLELRAKYIFNPDNENGVIVGATAAALLPTGDESSGVGGDLRLRLSKWELGNSGKHGIHGNLRVKYNPDAESGQQHLIRDDEEDERDFRFGAVLGYTYAANEKTNLVLDFLHEQLDEEGHESNVIEAGLTRKLGDSTTLAIGVGAGLGEDSPDYTAKAGLQFRF